MNKFKKQTFLQGAVIIAVSHLIVKIIGAAFKIPLARFVLGPDGMGIYNTSYTIFNWLFVVTTAGLPIAISKMVSENAALGRYREAHKVFRVSLLLMFIMGFVGAVIMYFGAGFFAAALKTPTAYYTIIAMMPSILFVALSSAYRGYFQGLQNMYPTAISEIIESCGKLFAGLGLGLLFLKYGKEFAAAGAIAGVTIGTALGAAAMYIFYLFSNNKIKSNLRASSEKTTSARKILRRLIDIAVPITLGASIFTLTGMIDLYMIMDRLSFLGFSETMRKTLYGYYSGYAFTLFSIPITVVVALSISIVPAIAGAYALKHFALTRRLTESALRITVYFAMPCAAFLSVMSVPLLQLLYDDINAGKLLSILSCAAVFVCLVIVSNAILQATGNVWSPVFNMLIGGLVKIVVNYYLVGNPEININGAPIGTNLCYLTILVLNLVSISNILKVRYKITEFLIFPSIATLSMAICSAFIYDRLWEISGSIGLSLLLAVFVGVASYIAVLFGIGAIKEEDIQMLPKGDIILQKSKLMHLMK